MKKAAFLLFAAAWLTGSAHAGHGRSNGCCSAPAPSCNSCCEREGLLDRLRARFHRNDCCDPCPAPRCEVRTCAPACPAPSCGNHGPRRRFLHRSDCCQPVCKTICQPVCRPVCQPACQPVCRPTNCCNDCQRPGLLDRLRHRFRRDNCCSDPCCGSTGGAVVTPKSGEVITTPPKKLPGGGKTSLEGGPTGEVRIITPPTAPGFTAPGFTAPTITPPAITPPSITIPATPGLDPRNPF